MDQPNKFRTKTGFCHILEHRLVLNREQEIKEGLKLQASHSMTKYLIFYGLAILAIIYCIRITISSGEVFTTTLLGLVSVIYLYGWISCFFFSGTPVIYKKEIEKIEFKKGFAGLTRGRFVVHLKLLNGKKKKRMILMLGVLTGGEKGTAEAMSVMKAHNLYPFIKQNSDDL